MRTSFLASEFLLVFCAIPLLASIRSLGIPHLPTLVVVAVACWLVLRRDRTFDRRRLWNLAGVRDALPEIGRRAFAALVALTAIIGFAFPDRFFDLPRERPLVWVALVALYPIASAWPQELVFRAFLMHRYRPIFGDGRLAIVASAIAFSFMHVVYMNWPALLLTLPAGALLALTYRRTGSLAASTLEHALYGILVFTLGMGRYFSSGLL